MSYMWDEFNIKTFPAEIVVFRNGIFCPELSTLPDTDFYKTYEKPIHIIYVGEITGKNQLNINIFTENQKFFLSANIKNKKPAFLNIFIKNAGKNSEFRGQIMLENESELNLNCTVEHAIQDTTILLKNKLFAHKNTISKLSGISIINKNCKNAVSDISFSALADKKACVEFLPAQKISAIPKTADHSASIYRPSLQQIEYLRTSGLTGSEVKNVLIEAFLNDFSLF